MAEIESVTNPCEFTTQEQHMCATKHYESAKENLQYLQAHPKRFSAEKRKELVEANNSLFEHYNRANDQLTHSIRELIEIKESLKKAQNEINALKKAKPKASVAKQPAKEKQAGSTAKSAKMKINKPHPECVLKIYPKSSKSADETKALVTGVDLSDTEIGINGIWKGGRNSVSVCCRNSEETDKLKNIIINKLGDEVSAEKPKQRNPSISVMLPSSKFGDEIDDKKLVQELRSKNPFGVTDLLKIVYKRRTKINDHLIIFELGPWNFKVLKEELKMKLHVGWSTIFAREQKPVSQCFNCYKFWHKAGACKFEIDGTLAKRCPRCGGNHEVKNCSTAVCCPNCTEHNRHARGRKLDTKHAANDPNCFVYRDAIEKGKSLINYRTEEPEEIGAKCARTNVLIEEEDIPLCRRDPTTDKQELEPGLHSSPVEDVPLQNRSAEAAGFGESDELSRDEWPVLKYHVTSLLK